ncbi:MAG: hypothetical protein HYZ22_12595 [Chloroflexi bacterium]|nr:hypothetical protein [Chloroflexota bacterium]
MKKMFPFFLLAGFLVFSACTANSEKDIPIPAPLTVQLTQPPAVDPNYFLTATIVPFVTLAPTATFEGIPAIVNIALNMGSGGAGFSANLYAQEVYTGRTVGIFMSAGMHTAPLLPTSPPLDMAVPAPGTYVFYARLSNDPMDYHYGYTECQVPTDCVGSPLIAFEVQPGQHYTILIADRKALLPGIDERGLPVTVPFKLVESNP